MTISIAIICLAASLLMKRASMAPITPVRITTQLINHPNQEMAGDDLAYLGSSLSRSHLYLNSRLFIFSRFKVDFPHRQF
ncbi:hypothetical protein HDV62DRAFT_372743 [Trichoderma sp. SZMC 28011]